MSNKNDKVKKLVFLALTTIILGTIEAVTIIPAPFASAADIILPDIKCPNGGSVFDDPIGCAPLLPDIKCPNGGSVFDKPIGCAPLKPGGN